MVTEVVEIVIRERGGAAASKSITAVGRASSGASSAVTALQSALAALGLALGARAILNAADEFTRIERAIGQSTKATGDAAAVQAELLAISNRTTTSLSENAKLFQRLRVATNSVGASNQEVLQVVEGLNAALVLSGASASEAGGGLVQLAQGLASGRLAGDELRSVLENLPTLGQALSRELGTELGGNIEVTVGKLRELGAEGKLTAQVVFPALQRAVKDFSSQLDKTPRTFEETVNVLRNQFIVVVGELNKELGGTTGLNGVIIDLAKNLRSTLFTGVSIGIQVFGVLGRAAIATAESIADVVNAGRAVLGTFREFQINRLRNSLDPALQAQGAFAGEEGQRQLAANRAELARLEKQNDALALSFEDSDKKFSDFLNSLNDGLSAIERTGEALGRVANEAPKAIPAPGTPGGVSTATTAPVLIGPTAEELKQRAKEERDFQKIVADLRAQAEKDAQEQKTALQGLQQIQDGLNRSIAEEAGPRALAIHDLEVEIARAKELAAAAGQDPAGNAVVQALQAQLAKVKLSTEGGQALAASVTGAVGAGITDAVRNGASLSDALGTSFQNAANASLTAGFDDALGTLQKGLGSAFDVAARDIQSKLPPALQGAAGAFGSALTSTLGFLAQQGIAALFGGGGNSQNSSSAGIKSAVTSTEAVRGIVAGPSQIAIAEVGNSIAEGFQPIAVILTEILSVDRRQLDILERAGSGRPGTGGDALTLATQSAPLASS